MLDTEDEEDFKDQLGKLTKFLLKSVIALALAVSSQLLTANAKLSDGKTCFNRIRENQENAAVVSAPIGVLYYSKNTDVSCYGATSSDVGITLSAKKVHLSSRVEDRPGSATNRIIYARILYTSWRGTTP